MARPELLILDDFGLKKFDAEKGHDFNDLFRERGGKSTVITTQLSIVNWGEVLEDPVVADTIIDQLAHTTIKLIITGTIYEPAQVGGAQTWGSQERVRTALLPPSMRTKNRPKNSFGRWLWESYRFPCGPKVDKTGVISVVLRSGVSCSESQGPARGGVQ